jgi:CubicO group peptidase (beta-lactamase class C family)
MPACSCRYGGYHDHSCANYCPCPVGTTTHRPDCDFTAHCATAVHHHHHQQSEYSDDVFLSAPKARLNAVVDAVVASGRAVNAFSVCQYRGHHRHSRYAGNLSRTSTRAFDGDSIIRLASMSKFIGTVGFLRLLEAGLVQLSDPLSRFVSAFANTKVMQRVTNTVSVVLPNSLSTTSASLVVTIAEAGHSRVNGDVVVLGAAATIGGLTTAQLNGLAFVVSNVVAGVSYDVTVGGAAATSTDALAGGSAVTVYTLAAGVVAGASIGGVPVFYRLVALTRAITVYDVLRHTLGYCHSVRSVEGSAAVTSFGYLTDPGLRNTQAALMVAAGVTGAVADPLMANATDSIQVWAARLATVPLLFQPGADWCYGTGLSILGALIEVIDDDRTLDVYMREEVFAPLCMNDTGFFMAPDDPRVARFAAAYDGLGIGSVAGDELVAVNAPYDWAGYAQDATYNPYVAARMPWQVRLLAGGLYSTANDFMKFALAVLRDAKAHCGVRLLAPATVALLSQNHVLDYDVHNLYDATGLGVNTMPARHPQWGLGVAILSGNTVPSLLPALSSHAIGWLGAFGTAFVIDFANQLVYVNGSQQFPTLALDNFRARAGLLTYTMLPEVHTLPDQV